MNDKDIKELFEGVNLKHHQKMYEILDKINDPGYEQFVKYLRGE